MDSLDIHTAAPAMKRTGHRWDNMPVWFHGVGGHGGMGPSWSGAFGGEIFPWGKWPNPKMGRETRMVHCYPHHYHVGFVSIFKCQFPEDLTMAWGWGNTLGIHAPMPLTPPNSSILTHLSRSIHHLDLTKDVHVTLNWMLHNGWPPAAHRHQNWLSSLLASVQILLLENIETWNWWWLRNRAMDMHASSIHVKRQRNVGFHELRIVPELRIVHKLPCSCRLPHDEVCKPMGTSVPSIYWSAWILPPILAHPMQSDLDVTSGSWVLPRVMMILSGMWFNCNALQIWNSKGKGI